MASTRTQRVEATVFLSELTDPRPAGAPRSAGHAGLDQHVQYLADGPLPADGLTQWQMPLNLVAVPTTVLVLDDVARFKSPYLN